MAAELKPLHDYLSSKEDDVNVHLVNKDGSEFKSIEDQFYNPGDIPACNPENTCEVIQDFLGKETPMHYSSWYYDFKDKKEERIKEIEKRLFEINDEHLDLIKELRNIKNDLLEILTITLK